MGTRLKVVLDTNVYVSALGWRGKEHRIFRKCVAGEVALYLSYEILQEIERVLTYPKFGFTEEERKSFLRLIRQVGRVVMPLEGVHRITDDPSDDKFLTCAIAAEADVIVSGDRHLLRLGSFRRVRIVSPREFLNLLQD